MARDPSMTRQHFEHPSGATAVLESPAGWARNCYYVLTVTKADGTPATGSPERKSFSTPAEAREAAVELARKAMLDGWRPRLPGSAQPPPVDVVFRPNNTPAIDPEAELQKVVRDVLAEEITDSGRVWGMLAGAFPDSAARQAALARVMQQTADMRMQAIRRQEEARQRLLEQARLAAAWREVAAQRPRAPAQRLLAQPQGDDALRRLAGGEVPGERSKRRINLGE